MVHELQHRVNLHHCQIVLYSNNLALSHTIEVHAFTLRSNEIIKQGDTKLLHMWSPSVLRAYLGAYTLFT